jgi:hypothetical protein
VVQSDPLPDLPVAILADSLGEPAVDEDASSICDQALDKSLTLSANGTNKAM